MRLRITTCGVMTHEASKNHGLLDRTWHHRRVTGNPAVASTADAGTTGNPGRNLDPANIRPGPDCRERDGRAVDSD